MKGKENFSNSSHWSDHVSAGVVFVLSLIIYCITADRSASFWDCPEYITCASRLEIGHPPGNPIWMLAMRFATIPFANDLHAFVINICSGIFMALAAYFLARIVFFFTIRICRDYCRKHSHINIPPTLSASAASLCAGLSFSLCDSAWFSAVEAEVYAMSAFLTSLVIWLMLRWAQSSDLSRQRRYLILIAYITGLSLGVHQLNLLCIPVLFLIYIFKKNPQGNTTLKACGAIILSFFMIAAILIGMMNGTLSWAQKMELSAVNSMGLPYFSGTIAYLILLLILVLAAARSIANGSKPVIMLSLTLFLWFSGYFVFNDNIWLALALSAMLSAIVTLWRRVSKGALDSFLWSAAFILLGFFSFSLILIRGYAAPPMNEAAPTDIFALSSYIARDQYGSTPLLYGKTPYSKPMVEERVQPGKELPDYSRYILKKEKTKFTPLHPSPRLYHRSRMMTHEDSASNQKVIKTGKDGYILSDYTFSRVTTPELDMFFPRITGSSLSDIESYESWAGMTQETMEQVKISETFDSLGNPAGKIRPSGNREKIISYRPSFLQNLRFFLSYQVSYMYFRYLLWNFMGRQNDLHSTGEIDHGNFITGFSPADNLMLGRQELMPRNSSADNPGRNVYYSIPFILGITGIIFLLNCGKKGRRTLAVFTIFFLMTGLAIVVYLNQTPGEPRERDYSFLGSYMAFAAWIGFGAAGIGLWSARTHLLKKLSIGLTCISAIIPPAIIAIENIDDHDRRGRSHPRDFASNILLEEEPAIIFSHGDNFSFPLWYTQEVEGIGQQHTVIDISYFATPEYIINLLKQGERGIKLTAGIEDIAYGAYAYTHIAHDADTVPTPLLSILRELYSIKEGIPELRHRIATIPGISPDDTLKIDIKDYANGSSQLPFKKLMLLDLLATNLSSDSPRRVFFLSSLPADFLKPFKNATRRIPFAEMYYPPLTDSLYMMALKQSVGIALSSGHRNPERPAYIDPVIADQIRRQRGELIIAARKMLDAGDSVYALKTALAAEQLHPYDAVSAGSFTTGDSTFHEGIEFSRLLIDCSGNRNFRSLASKASGIVGKMLSESKEWRRYYSSLPEWRRNTVSNSTRRLISIIKRLEKMQMECDSINNTTADQQRDNSITDYNKKHQDHK